MPEFNLGELYYLLNPLGGYRFVKILEAGQSTLYLRPYAKPPSFRWVETGVPTLWIDPQADDIAAGAVSGSGVRVLKVDREELRTWRPVFLRVVSGMDADEAQAMNGIELESIPQIAGDLLVQLLQIDPSQDRDLQYRPSRVRLKDGTVMDRVYLVEAEPYIRLWGSWPQLRAGHSVALTEITRIEDSPHRLPARLATKMYRAGESAMGACFFVLVLRDGRRLPCATGNAVDFVEYPAGVAPSDVVDLLPHDRGSPGDWKPAEGGVWENADYVWCLYRLSS